ncbi:MAG: hypothetical protein LBT85_01310 [Bifidobacteriaceae bacterium]|jgi:hypothetical protein|nr:hypothetical protein [Bifidobacteriaceae bacterium]
MFLEIITIVTMLGAVIVSCVIAFVCYKIAKALLRSPEDNLKEYKPVGLFKRTKNSNLK